MLISFSLCLSILTNACTNNPVLANVEEARLPLALNALPLRLAEIEQQAVQHSATIALKKSIDSAKQTGNRVWRQAVQQTQQGLVDDRPLYWQRLASMQKLRKDCHHSNCKAKLDEFDLSSRGIQDILFHKNSGLRILITGFDPFALDREVTQTNPSGVLALQLDNRVLTNKKTAQTAQLQAVIFPVRFADFDQGMVEQLLTPLMQNAEVDVVITLSMGRDGFDLERFPGKRRATTATDNQNRTTGASATNPLLPLLDGKPMLGPEFVEFSLPAQQLAQVQNPYPVVDNRQVSTLEDGQTSASSLAALTGKTAIAGSGGTYLSNEISYRSIALSQRLNVELPIGHIHLPRLTGYDKTTLLNISSQLQAMLRQAIPALTLDSNNPNPAPSD